MVLQDTWIFEGALRENFLFGMVDVTEGQVVDIIGKCYFPRWDIMPNPAMSTNPIL